jgi:hypothetical protein
MAANRYTASDAIATSSATAGRGGEARSTGRQRECSNCTPGAPTPDAMRVLNISNAAPSHDCPTHIVDPTLEGPVCRHTSGDNRLSTRRPRSVSARPARGASFYRPLDDHAGHGLAGNPDVLPILAVVAQNSDTRSLTARLVPGDFLRAKRAASITRCAHRACSQ